MTYIRSIIKFVPLLDQIVTIFYLGGGPAGGPPGGAPGAPGVRGGAPKKGKAL